MYLKICPLLGFYEASVFTLLKTFRENIPAPSLRVKQPRNNVVEVTGCLLKQYRRQLRPPYVMQVTLTLCRTSICVDKTAVTSHGKKISILHLHSLRGFTLVAITNEI
jgi:hypothetical protein